MLDWAEHKYAYAGILILLALLACVAISPSLVNEGNVSLPPQRAPAATETIVDENTPEARASQGVERENVVAGSSPSPTVAAGRPPSTEPAPSATARPTATATETIPATATPAGPQPLEVLEKLVVRDASSGRASWFVILKNHNAGWSFEDVVVRVVDTSGRGEAELGSLTLQSVRPGEMAGLGEPINGADTIASEALEVQIEPGRVTADTRVAALRVEAVRWQPRGAGGQISALVANQLDGDLVGVALLGIVRDGGGAPVAVQSGQMSFLPGNGETGVVISFPAVSGGVVAELFVARTSSTQQLPRQPPPLIDVVAQSLIAANGSGAALWAALFESHHPAGTVVDSEVLLTLLDASGAVAGVSAVNIGEIRPGERTAVVVRFDANPALAAAGSVIYHVRYGAVVEAGPGAIAVEDTLYLDDQGIPRVEGNLRSSVGRALADVEVVALAFDAAGTVIGAGVGLVPDLPASGWAFAQVRLTLDDDAAQVAEAEMYVGAAVNLRLDGAAP